MIETIEQEETALIEPIATERKWAMGLGVFVLLLLFFQGPLDPTPINALWPEGGVWNFLGLPGSLFAGLLLDLWGQCAYLFVAILLFLSRRFDGGLLAGILGLILSVFSLSLFLGLILPFQGLELADKVGLIGVTARSMVQGTPFYWMFLAISLAYLMRMAYYYVLDVSLVRVFLGMLSSAALLLGIVSFGFRPLVRQLMAALSGAMEPLLGILYPIGKKASPREGGVKKAMENEGDDQLHDALKAYRNLTGDQQAEKNEKKQVDL